MVLVFLRRSAVCPAPSVPSERELEEEACVALYTYTQAKGPKPHCCWFSILESPPAPWPKAQSSEPETHSPELPVVGPTSSTYLDSTLTVKGLVLTRKLAHQQNILLSLLRVPLRSQT